MIAGTIKVLTERGWGLIKGEDGKEYFFHRSDLADGLSIHDLRERDEVNFEPRETAKGPRAERVSVVGVTA